MSYTLGKLAEIIGGTVKGDDQIQITGANGIENAQQGDISFVSNQKYLNNLSSTEASALLMDSSLYKPSYSIACLLVENTYSALADLLAIFSPVNNTITTNEELSFVHDEAQLAENVSVGLFSIIEKGATIGKNTRIFGQVYIGDNVIIGDNCTLFPGVKVYSGCEIGNNVILHANSIIGSDGFGFAPLEDGSFKKIPQIGNVIIESDVEIGANTVIDRASMGSTIVRTGTKLDNLIQIAHNVEIGEHTVIAAQAGIAGSSKIGRHCQIGGQSGIVGHLQIADQTMIQAQSGMTKSVNEKGTKWYGSPAIDYNNYLKSFAIYKNLPDLQSRINKLEKLLGELQQSLNK